MPKTNPPVNLAPEPVADEQCLTCMHDPCACGSGEDGETPTPTRRDGLIHVEVPIGKTAINVYIDPSKSNRKMRRLLRSAQSEEEGETFLYTFLSRMVVRWDLTDAHGRPVLTCERIPAGTPEYAEGRECLEDVDDAIVIAIWESIQQALGPNGATSGA